MRRSYKAIRVMLMAALLVGSTAVAQAAGYKYGDKGGDIVDLQKKLVTYGYKARVNGEYDANTKWAVRLFQRDHHMEVDGITGPDTYKAIMGKPFNESRVGKITRMDKAKLDKEMADSRAAAAKRAANSKQGAGKKVVRKGSADDSLFSGIHRDPVDEDFKFAATTTMSKEVKSLLAVAEQYKGVPYVFGGTTPQGFDCSGYTRYVFAKAGINLPRMADEQYNVGKAVDKQHLQPGDLVFFETYEPGVSHSGIYIGNGRFISATSSRGVAIADLSGGYWGSRYIGAKRVM